MAPAPSKNLSEPGSISPIVPGKPSSLANLSSHLSLLDEFTVKYKPLVAVALVTAFLKATTLPQKTANLVALFELYQSSTTYDAISKLSTIHEEIASAFGYMKSLYNVTFSPTSTTSEDVEKVQDLVNQGVIVDGVEIDIGVPHVDLLNPPYRANPGLLGVLDTHMKYVKPVIGILGMLCVALGFDTVIESTLVGDFAKRLKTLSTLIVSKRIIKEEISSGVDDLLGLLYSSCGGEYVRPELQKHRMFATKCQQFEKKCHDILVALKYDYFNTRKHVGINALNQEISQLYDEHTILTSSEKSVYNQSDILHNAKSHIMAIREIMISMARVNGGKVEPVTVFMFGKPGVGKSRASVQIANNLCGSSVYPRTSSDKWWNNYCGQECTIIDDLGQFADSDDLQDWHKNSSEVAIDVPMAALEAKGTPFSSSLMIATTNWPFLIIGHKHGLNLDSFHRRRMFFVYCSFVELQQYHADNANEDPPPSFYEKHRMRYFLYDPRNMDCDFTSNPNPDTKGFIGEVSLDELIVMVSHRMSIQKEKHRKHLLANKVEMITIPETPFVTNWSLAYPTYYFDPITKLKKTMLPICNSPPPPPPSESSETPIGQEVVYTLEQCPQRASEYVDIGKKKFMSCSLDAFECIGLRDEFVKFIDESNELDVLDSFMVRLEAIHTFLLTSINTVVVIYNNTIYSSPGSRYAKRIKELDMTTEQYLKTDVNDYQFIVLAKQHYTAWLPRPIKPEAINVSPITVTVQRNPQSVLVLGEPGLGKTVAVKKALDANKVQYYEVLADDTFTTIKHQTGVLFFDDVTTTSPRWELYRDVSRAYDAGQLQINALIATANPSTPQWEEKGSQEQVSRRAHVVKFDLMNTSARMIKNLVHRASAAERLQGRDESYFEDHIIITDSRGKFKLSNFSTHLANIMQLDRNCLLIDSAVFCIPEPECVDYVIKTTMNFKDLLSTEVTVANAPELQKRYSVIDVKTKQAPSYLRQCEIVSLFRPLFSSQAYGNPTQFASSFNAEGHLALTNLMGKPYDLSVLIAAADVSFGFVSSIDDRRTVCYLVDKWSVELRVVDGDLYVRNELIVENPINQVYHNIARKVLGTQYSPTYSGGKIASIADDVMLQEVIAISPLSQCIKLVCCAAGLLIKTGCALVLLSSLSSHDERSDNCSKEVDNRLSRREKFEEEKKQHNSFQAPRDPSPGKAAADVTPRNVVTVEKKQRNSDQPPRDPSPGKAAADVTPRNVVTVEKKKSNSDQPPRDPSPGKAAADVTPKNVVTVESVYDRMLLRRGRTSVLEGTMNNADGTIVINDEGSFGVVYGGYIYYASMAVEGKYQILVVPITGNWSEVDPTSYPNSATAGKKQYNVKYNLTNIDHHSLKAIVGTHYNFIAGDQLDFSSVFAFVYAHGIPLDYDRKVLLPALMPKMFTENISTRPPASLTWYMKAVFPQTYALLTKKNVQLEGMCDPQLEASLDVVANNMVRLFKTDDPTSFMMSGIMLGGRLGITTAHAGESFYVYKNDQFWPAKRVSYNSNIDLQTFEIPDKKCSSSPEIFQHAIKKEDLLAILTRQTRGIKGCLMAYNTNIKRNMLFNNFCVIQPEVITSDSPVAGCTGSYSASLGNLGTTGVSVAGYCGSALFVCNSQVSGKFCGIHKAGSGTSSVCTYVTREMLREIYDNPQRLSKIRGGSAIDNFKPECLRPIRGPEQVHVFAQAAICPRTKLMKIGKLPKPMYMPSTTRIRATGFKIASVFRLDQFEPSAMRSGDPRIVGDSPKIAGLKRYAVPANTNIIDRTAVADAMVGIGNWLSDLIIQSGLHVQKFSKTEALNGPDTFEYPKSKAVDRTGSAGFPHNYFNATGTTKGDFVEFNPAKGQWYFKHTTGGQLISSLVNEIEQDALKGIERMIVFEAYLKDEPLKLSKIYHDRKTRMFFCGPFEYLIAHRMYFLSAIQRITELYASHPIKVGISTNMEDWHGMSSSLEQMGPTGFASDIKCFDSSVPTDFLEECTRAFNIIYSRCSRPGEDVQAGNLVRKVLHRAVEGAYFACCGDVFKLTQAQTSGNPGTATENSMILWALYYIVWKRLAERHTKDWVKCTFKYFMDNVCLVVFGDDNACTVRPGHDWFNFNTFKEEAFLFGFNVTDAAKSAGAVPDRQRLDEMEFLKRDFVKRNSFWYGQIQLFSIAKSTEWIRGDGSSYEVTADCVPSLGGQWPLATNVSVIESSLQANWPEIAVHGKETYDTWVAEILRQAGPLGVVLHPPTWQNALKELGYNVNEPF